MSATPKDNSRSGRATAETLLSFMEWGQGFLRLEDALLRTVECFGAASGAIVRIRLKTLESRTVAVVSSVREKQRPDAPLAVHIIGNNAKILKLGVPFLMSSLDDSRLFQSSEIEVWKEKKLGRWDIGFICLSRGNREADFLEMHFRDVPGAIWDREAGWYASALARVFEVRRPGLITEALARNSSNSNQRLGGYVTILGASNPTGLTRTEFKVCLLLSRGLALKAVVCEMGVSIATVRSHLRNIYAKTGVDGYHKLALRLVSPEERNALRWPEQMSA